MFRAEVAGLLVESGCGNHTEAHQANEPSGRCRGRFPGPARRGPAAALGTLLGAERLLEPSPLSVSFELLGLGGVPYACPQRVSLPAL